MSNEEYNATLLSLEKLNERLIAVSNRVAEINVNLKQREREGLILACVSITVSLLAVSIGMAAILRTL